MGCNESVVSIASNNTGNEPCEGYELRANLDFDTGTKGTRADDTYYNNGAGWQPIGSAANPYAAKFDGGNATYTITNLHVNLSSTSETSHAGLFGVIGTGAEIQNVALTGVSVTGSTTSTVVYVGALAGRNQGTITESWSLGAVTGHRTGTGVGDDSIVGGLVGRNDGTIRAAYSRAAATATAHDSNEALAGGLVGHNSDAGAIAASYAAGDATANRGTDTTGAADNNSFAGGLVGQNGGKITASYATGDGAAVGKNTHAGGLVGDNNGAINTKAAITASYSLGKPSAATGTGTERKGGLVGANRNHATITASYWDKTTSEITTGSNGVGKTTSELQTPTAYGTGSSIYANWNVNVDGKTRQRRSLGLRHDIPIPRPRLRQPRRIQTARRSNHHRVPHHHLGTRRHRTKPRQRIHHHRIPGRRQRLGRRPNHHPARRRLRAVHPQRRRHNHSRRLH